MGIAKSTFFAMLLGLIVLFQACSPLQTSPFSSIQHDSSGTGSRSSGGTIDSLDPIERQNGSGGGTTTANPKSQAKIVAVHDLEPSELPLRFNMCVSAVSLRYHEHISIREDGYSYDKTFTYETTYSVGELLESGEELGNSVNIQKPITPLGSFFLPIGSAYQELVLILRPNCDGVASAASLKNDHGQFTVDQQVEVKFISENQLFYTEGQMLQLGFSALMAELSSVKSNADFFQVLETYNGRLN